MLVKVHIFALVAGITAALCVVAVSAGQRNNKAVSNPPASPQAKTSQPATHFTQGTITSIQANQIVITRTVRGKAGQMTFTLTPQTQRSGNLVAGTRVSVQYREANNQNIAAAVSELSTKDPANSGKTALKPKSKG
jgi:NH3-dependent NAD+ synthetase